MSSPTLTRALARLDQLVNWERRDRDAAMRRDLEPIASLLAQLGNPHERFRAVHVTGTKGKGSTSALVEAGLRRAGLRTGLYTSPHLERVQERIRIEGREVADAALAAALERVLDARAAAEPASDAARSSWFDVLTAAAFVLFAEAEVEWAVVEVGLGGRLDSTNVVRGEVCVITNIDLEHTSVLGSTRVAIAHEKAGILKPGSALVTAVPEVAGPPGDDPGRVIADRALELGLRVLRPAPFAAATTMLERNTELARLVLEELGRRGVRSRAGEALRPGLLDATAIAAARLPGRAERRWVGRIPVVLDAAHVASSVRLLLDELSRDRELPSLPVVVLALGREKDAGSILKELAGRVDRLVSTTVASGPLADAETLAQAARARGIAAETAADPARALARALEHARDGRWVLVVGSFYLAGAVRERTSPTPTASRS